MFEGESFAQENLMIELSQMPPTCVLDGIYQNNIEKGKEEFLDEVQMLSNIYQVWSWA